MSQSLKTVFAVIIIIAGIGLIFITINDTPQNASDDNNSPTATTSTSSVSVPQDWEQYENAEFDFTVAHPPNADVQIEGPDNNHVKFTYLGSDNATGEITDGFTITVSTYENVTSSLEAFANTQASDNPAAESVSDVEETTFRDQTAYRFTTETLGTVENLVIPHSDNRAMVVSSNVSDPNSNGYQDMADTMLASLNQHNISGGEEPASGTVEEIKIALLDSQLAEGEEPDRGCDQVAMVSREISETQAPLTAAMNELFRLQQEQVQGFRNFIARTNDTLSFQRARVSDDTAHIYLSGELSGLAGVCDDPRAQIQIEETALQFPTVENVQIYRNGEPTDLTPSQR